MIFPMWHINSALSKQIKTSRIFFGVLVGVVFLPSLFVIFATALNILIGFGYSMSPVAQRLFYLSAQTLPFALISILASTPFCFAARQTGHIGLLAMQIFALSIFTLLAAALWVAQLVEFSVGLSMLLALISAIFGLIQWLVMWFTCILPLRT